MRDAFRFYCLVFCTAPKRLMEAAHLAHTIVFLAGMVLLVIGVGSHEVNPWWGLSLLIASFVSFLLIGIYETHRDLLRRKSDRNYWAFNAGGGFFRHANVEWREVAADGTLINSFLEVACSCNFTELLDSGRQVTIRLYPEKADLKNGKKGRFAYYKEGHWIAAENPLLVRPGLSVRLELASALSVETEVIGDHVLYATVMNTSERSIVIKGFGVALHGEDVMFPFLCRHDKKPPEELAPAHSWSFFVEPERLAGALESIRRKGVITIEGICGDALGRSYRSQPVTFDIDFYCNHPEG